MYRPGNDPYIKQDKIKPNNIPHEFHFTRASPNVCKSTKGDNLIDLVIFIASSIKHRNKRQSLRDSWLSASRNNTSNMRYVFILGEIDKSALHHELKNEAEKFNDIVIANFQDTYQNLTLKTIAGYHWINKYCAHARFVMKTDDDVYVNIPSLLEHLVNKTDDYSFGKPSKDAPPIRDKNNKWYISFEDYPSATYPDYYNGFGYVLSMKHVRGLLNIYQNVKFVPFEDVFVGHCLKEMNVTVRDTELYIIVLRFLLPYCVYQYRNIIMVHKTPNSLMKTIHNKKCKTGEYMTQTGWSNIVKLNKERRAIIE